MSNQEHSDGPGRRTPKNIATRSRISPQRRGIALGVIVIFVALVVAFLVGVFTMHVRAGPPQAAAQDTGVHAPTNLAVFTADSEVVVSWQPARPAPDGYRVYRASGRRGPYMLLGTVNAPDIDTFVDDDRFILGVTYSYTVTAFNDDSESAPVGPAAIAVTAASLHLPPTPSPTPPPPRPVPTFDAGNAIPAVDEGTAGPAPTPLPTFRALTRAELTAIAREPKKRTTPQATPYSGISALLTPTATPVATAATTVGPVATAATTVGPVATAATTVGPAASPTPSAIAVNTPIATPTVLPPVVTETPTPTPTP